MQILPKNQIIARYPIRESEETATIYIDLDKNGELEFDDGFNNEPALPIGMEDIKEHAQKNGLQFVTKENYEEIDSTRMELESGSEDDWQFNEDDNLTEIANSLSTESVEWAINPRIDGPESEMEFIILRSRGEAPNPQQPAPAPVDVQPQPTEPNQRRKISDLKPEVIKHVQDLWKSLQKRSQ